jgi:cytoskeletal protein RodZ
VEDVSQDTERPLGEWLRRRREESDISLEQAETDTRIRLRYLQALEAEDFEALPDPVVGRGFLRNYAAYLSLDPLEASDRYSVLVAPPEPEPIPDETSSPFATGPFRPVPLHDMPGWRPRRGWLIGLILIVLVTIAVIAVWFYPTVSDWVAAARDRSGPTATPPATKAALPTATRTAAPTATPLPTAVAVAPTEALPTLEELSTTPTLTRSPPPSSTPSPPVYTGIFLELVFTDTSWIQVTVDGVRQFQGELEADTYRSWYGEDRIELRIGNAGAVQVTLNGQKLGALGAVGDVIDRIFEKVGEQVSEATPTETPTGSITVKPTEVSPTQTPVPSTLATPATAASTSRP